MRRPPEVRCNKALGVEGRRRALRTRNGVLPLEEDHPLLTGRLAARGFRCLAGLRDEAEAIAQARGFSVGSGPGGTGEVLQEGGVRRCAKHRASAA